MYIYKHQCHTYYITLIGAMENWLHYDIYQLHKNVPHEWLKASACRVTVVYYSS